LPSARLIDLVETSDVVDDDIKERITLRRGEMAKVDAELERLQAPKAGQEEFSHEVDWLAGSYRCCQHVADAPLSGPGLPDA
jgi:hypothetical protein